MIRFSLRNRARDTARDPADRPNKPLGKSIPVRSPPSSFLPNYDPLPTRLPDGLALDYYSYQPSPYFKPQSALQSRRPHDQPAPKTTIVTDLGLDFDSVQRSQTRPFDPLDFIPVEKRIQSKVAQLRSYLVDAENLGDIEVLKDLVGIHDATLNNHNHAAHLTRMQIKEAKIIAGISDPTPPYPDVEHTSIPIRKVPGNPIRHISGRTLSALKARSASGRSGQRGPIRVSTDRYRDHVNRNRNHSNFGRGKEVAKLSRKSSARLKRLGSAGSVLIRRLSKVSVAEDSSTASSNDNNPLSSTFDQETMRRLRSAPHDVIGEYEAELARLERTIEAETGKLREAKDRLETRRVIHNKVMQILDQFYGGLPGWENDAIARRMLPETAEMTEAGLEAERDLADARLVRQRAQAAFGDHERCLRELQFISVSLNTFIRQVEDMMLVVEQVDPHRKFVKMQASGLEDALVEKRVLLGQCIGQARIAVDCSVEAPRVGLLEKDLRKLGDSFSIEAGAVSRQGGLRRGDFAPSLHLARSALCDCRMAESFVAARVKMVGEDLATFDTRTERCEEYVMLERVGILDQYHPA